MAGATGQCQFMPSNVLVYGVDFDKDGKIDIWNNYGDIFASMAKLLKKAGWKKGRDIGMLAKKTKNKKFNYKRYRTPRQYNKLGLRTLDGDKLKGRWKRKIAKIPFQNSPVLLRGSNYKPLLRWNRSSLFAAMNVTLIEGFKR
jgi:membrane-bound lytic murein transglycosylase B